MTDAELIERLRAWGETDAEYGHFARTSHVLSAASRIEALVAEVERLRGRLEIDPAHPYDGIAARDETIKGLDRDNQRLREALTFILAIPDNGFVSWCKSHARAALGSQQP